MSFQVQIEPSSLTVEGRLQHLASSLDALETEVEALAKKLMPALRPPLGEENCASGKEIDVPVSPISATVKDLHSKVYYITRSICDIRRDLDL